MISFLRVDHVDATRDDGHICFASNASLAKRAHVSIQTVERHIAKLVSLGLLTRRPSGNGKRWARRDRKNELGRLRDMCSAALSDLKARLLPTEWDEGLLSKARNLLRRQPDKQVLSDLLAELSVEISKISSAEPEVLRANAPEIEGHKETSKTQYVKKETSFQIEVSQEECHRLMDDIAGYLNLGNTWFSIKDLGPALSFMILGYLLERSETISNHRGYAFKLSQDLASKSLDWRSLLKKPRSKF